jgi:hypothetical protein
VNVQIYFMTLDEQKDRIEFLLQAAGFERLRPVLYESSINDIEIWTGTLKSGWGSAKFEVRAYSFDNQPNLVVDYEEEKQALTSGRTQTAGWNEARVLLCAKRAPDVGILLTCRASDEHFFREMPPETTGGRYSYHPQLDRVLGGDYFRDFQGHPMKVYVTSLKRAQELYPLLGALHETFEQSPAWPGKLKYPVPTTLAVFALSENLLGSGAVPPEYHELALFLTVIASTEVVLDLPPSGQSARLECVTQLFRAMRVVHANRFTFSRRSGCNYIPAFVTPSGALNDAYFLWRDLALERAEELWQCQETDLINGMLTVAGLADEPAAKKREVLLECVRAYLAPASVQNDIAELTLDPGVPDSEFLRHVKRVAATVLATTADF